MTRDDPYWPEMSRLNGEVSGLKAEQMVMRPRLLEAEKMLRDATGDIAHIKHRMDTHETVYKADQTELLQTATDILSRMAVVEQYARRNLLDILTHLSKDGVAILVIASLFAVAFPEVPEKIVESVGNIAGFGG